MPYGDLDGLMKVNFDDLSQLASTLTTWFQKVYRKPLLKFAALVRGQYNDE